jgi:hypothetical protein
LPVRRTDFEKGQARSFQMLYVYFDTLVPVVDGQRYTCIEPGRRWASHHWICCDMHYKNMKHEAMGKGYTSLFFLDEVTALAAGHRPCFFCRRADAKNFIGGRKVPEFDRELHAQRLASHEAEVKDLPDGAMIEHEGKAYAVKGSRLLQWSHSQYGLAIPRASLMKARLLTPPLITAILAKGYQPRWHPSATPGEQA